MQPPQVPQYLRALVLAGHFPPSPEGVVCEKGQQCHVAEPHQLTQHRVLKPTVSPACSRLLVWGDGLHARPFLSPTGRPRETWPGALLNSKRAASVHTTVSVTRRSCRGPGILIQPGALPGQDPLDAKNRNKTNHTVKDNVNGKICAVTPGSSPGPGCSRKSPAVGLQVQRQHNISFQRQSLSRARDSASCALTLAGSLPVALGQSSPPPPVLGPLLTSFPPAVRATGLVEFQALGLCLNLGPPASLAAAKHGRSEPFPHRPPAAGPWGVTLQFAGRT